MAGILKLGATGGQILFSTSGTSGFSGTAGYGSLYYGSDFQLRIKDPAGNITILGAGGTGAGSSGTSGSSGSSGTSGNSGSSGTSGNSGSSGSSGTSGTSTIPMFSTSLDYTAFTTATGSTGPNYFAKAEYAVTFPSSFANANYNVVGQHTGDNTQTGPGASNNYAWRDINNTQIVFDNGGSPYAYFSYISNKTVSGFTFTYYYTNTSPVPLPIITSAYRGLITCIATT
jgi:hypothetical protein